MNRRIGVLVTVLGAVMLFASGSYALNNGYARTPPMGFNTWNWFGCNGNGHATIDENLIKAIADAFVSTGMRDSGYKYVNVDDCWGEPNRDAGGGIVAAKSRFPGGMKALADYVHSKGCKLGIYTDVAGQTCAQTMPGLSGHEKQDCDTFVKWGIDYAKVDWCSGSGNTMQAYRNVREAIGGRFCFSICNWGTGSPWLWGDSIGNLWRTTGDINSSWGTILSNMDNSASLNPYSRPGSWNDPDMLEVGNGPNDAQCRAHFSLWCMMAAPLIAGNDVRNMGANIKSILTNGEVIRVDQDTLGGVTQLGKIQGRRVVSGASEVWVKMLRNLDNADYAVLFFNRSNSGSVTISATTAQLSAIGGGMASGKVYNVRDLWGHADKGTWTAGGSLSTPSAVPVNDVYMVKLSVGVAVLRPIASAKVVDWSVSPEKNAVIVKTASPNINKIALVNAQGVRVYSGQFSGRGEVSIPTQGFARGLYFISVTNGQETFSDRLLLK